MPVQLAAQLSAPHCTSALEHTDASDPHAMLQPPATPHAIVTLEQAEVPAQWTSHG